MIIEGKDTVFPSGAGSEKRIILVGTTNETHKMYESESLFAQYVVKWNKKLLRKL